MSTVLKTQNLFKKYGEKVVSDNISLTINKGDIYGFVGKNGAGKTTFMRQVLGLAFQDGGTISLFDGEPLSKARRKIGSLIEAPAIYKNCTAYENMKRMAILTNSTDAEVRSILEFVGLADTGNKKSGQFSLGMRQRLGIAIALLGNPDFLILDEPINGLDPTGIIEIRDLIIRLNKEKDITFMISSHLLEELSKIATRYGFISDGRLIEEISAQELAEKCSDRVLIKSDNPQKSAELLSKFMPAEQIHIYNNVVYLDSMLNKTAEINKYLIENGIMVSELSLHSINLEEYFLRKVGA
ncbi:ATP-binding cassette domain-containing protein [Ruminococcus sp.]|uniref:ATP-binding cassette domain-containing protein n=1 Tax=Ruminococcus sp. TaxID=41978 RepID=UPI003867D2E5